MEEKKLKSNADAVRDYQNKLDDIKIRVPAGYREKIKEYAATKEMSTNQLVITLINEDAVKNNYELEIPSGIKATKADK